ncbi:glycosyltransferase family 2 protein [Vibrio sp.]|uniref:glycosyltransferase family 2 protein n=1 Tax=Vibrio sp. TaxID=678 RepID=UPI00311D86B8
MAHISPAVSVVIPAFNASRYIRETLNSVLSQTFADFEIIVVDDCSSDETKAIVMGVSQLDDRVTLICLDENMGAPAGPRNIGVRAAKGRWVAFLDADDIWHPRKLEEQVKLLRCSGGKFCSTASTHFNHTNKVTFPSIVDIQVERISYFQQQLKCRTPASSVLVDTDLIKKHPFNESLTFKAREDLDCWLHCHEEIGFSLKITNPLIGYRISDGQISGNKWTMFRRHLHVLKAYRKMDGSGLGFSAYMFTASHFLLSLYSRYVKRGL